MSLSDLMGGMGLSIWTQVALVLFLLVFVAEAVWTFLPRNQAVWQRAVRLPLDDDAPHDAGPPPPRHE